MHELDELDIQAVVEILKSNQITQGKTVEKFGQALADYTGAKYGLALSSGTAALHISVVALEIGPGDEVITTPMTFCATANAALYQGAAVKLVDINENNLNLDPNLLEEKITKKTRAVIPIDFRGYPANLPEIKKIAEMNSLSIIEDGSHSIGSTYIHNENKHFCGDGVHADICTYSFHPVKHITTGEGGAILTNNEKIFKTASLLRKHGIDRRPEMFDEKKRIGSWVYDTEILGFNYRITDFQAALGISQLRKLDKIKSRRREIVNYYNEHLSSIPELILPYEDKFVSSNFHLYVLQIAEKSKYDRYDLFNYLKSKNYNPMVHYIPIHLLSYYQKRLGYKKGDFPIAEKVYDRSISIPLYPSLTDIEIEKIVKEISYFFKK